MTRNRWCNGLNSTSMLTRINFFATQRIFTTNGESSAVQRTRKSTSDWMSPFPLKIMKTMQSCKFSKMPCQVDDFDLIWIVSNVNRLHKKTWKGTRRRHRLTSHLFIVVSFKMEQIASSCVLYCPQQPPDEQLIIAFFHSSFHTKHSTKNSLMTTKTFFFLFSPSSSSYSVQLLESRVADIASEEPSWTGRNIFEDIWKVRRRRLSWMEMGKIKLPHKTTQNSAKEAKNFNETKIEEIFLWLQLLNFIIMQSEFHFHTIRD